LIIEKSDRFKIELEIIIDFIALSSQKLIKSQVIHISTEKEYL